MRGERPRPADGKGAKIGRVLFLSHSHAFGPFRVGSHHYADELARRGIEVVHVSTPLSLAHRVVGRVDRATTARLPVGPSRPGDGALHLVPRTLLPTPLGGFRVRRELARHGIDTRFDAVLIDQPLLWDPSVRSLAPRLIYRPTDLYPSGTKLRLQRRIVAAADGVMATSSEVLRSLGDLRVPTMVIENGVNVEHFAPTVDDVESRPAVCLYVGALDGRFDWAQLGDWARRHPDVRFIVAGPDATTPAALPPNIDIVGPVPYDGSLVAVMRSARVGLLPLSDDVLNAGRSPMKLNEYLAAGLAVVSRETPVIRSDENAGLFTYRDRAEADAALVDALAHTSPNTAGTQRAREESWDTKTDTMTAFLSALPPR